MTKTKTTARTLRFDDEILTWGKRAAQKQKISPNKFFVSILRQAFEQRHTGKE